MLIVEFFNYEGSYSDLQKTYKDWEEVARQIEGVTLQGLYTPNTPYGWVMIVEVSSFDLFLKLTQEIRKQRGFDPNMKGSAETMIFMTPKEMGRA